MTCQELRIQTDSIGLVQIVGKILPHRLTESIRSDAKPSIPDSQDEEVNPAAAAAGGCREIGEVAGGACERTRKGRGWRR